MAEYTWNPAPVFEAAQVSTQADGDAWVASLTDFELRNDNDGIVFTDVRIEVEEELDRFWLKWTRTDGTDGTRPQQLSAPLGGYAIADKTGQIALWAEDEENFTRRFQPYVECPPEPQV
jgi:hypothetical protein